MKRRTFLKIAGIGSISIAAGCNTRADKNLFTLVEAPDDMVTGKALWYAATCRECPAGCGILAKNREGRIVKVEGHPTHPVNQGALCMRGQSAVQAIFHPDRLKTPMLKEDGDFKPISFEDATLILKDKLNSSSKQGPDNVAMLTEVVGESLYELFADSLKAWDGSAPVVFEAYAYESLKKANRVVFGIDGLPSYKMEDADLVVSFGADFLETWLSPVEYARKFKRMHGFSDGSKGAFVHVSPYRSMTGTNADLWISCEPGGEAAVGLGLIREVLASGRAEGAPGKLVEILEEASGDFTPEKVAEVAGVSPEGYDKLCKGLLKAKKPLVLGRGVGASESGAYAAEIAANLLNLLSDPDLSLIDFSRRHRVECAQSRARAYEVFESLKDKQGAVVLLNNVNPVYAFPPETGVRDILSSDNVFAVSFSNFMDETAMASDLVFPVGLALESWDEYAGTTGIVSTTQPAMGNLSKAPDIGDVFLRAASESGQVPIYKEYLFEKLKKKGLVENELDWLYMIQHGGIFEDVEAEKSLSFSAKNISLNDVEAGLEIKESEKSEGSGLTMIAAPSIRFFDGRTANRPWVNEIPDPATKVAWQTPILGHPETLSKKGIPHAGMMTLKTAAGTVKAPAYHTESVRPGVLVVWAGQGHEGLGRYAQGQGANPFGLLAATVDEATGAPCFSASASITGHGNIVRLAHTDGSIDQHERKIALSVALEELLAHSDEHGGAHGHKQGLGMWDFPLTLPVPEGYDKKRDFYPPHEHDGYRWSMIVDLDRCIGCGACAAACYAENNIGVVGEKRIVEQREMSWLAIQRYTDMTDKDKIVFLPMLCQHCDNAPCESVCPVYAPHHSKEGLNNQIYNRCIGTRFCSQNCPYKVRRFNWFEWKWPKPLNLQLNPDVTVRAKGVMEKCSFCIQRIKEAHGKAKDENREIRDGEVIPACAQTCPTGVFTFGNLMDENSRVRKMVEDVRAYQIMGYLNTKPAVIYLKKVVREI